jgi:GNAT superfamily N-acetyltransferase
VLNESNFRDINSDKKSLILKRVKAIKKIEVEEARRFRHQAFPGRKHLLALSKVQTRRKNMTMQFRRRQKMCLQNAFDRMRAKLEPSEIKFQYDQSFPSLRNLGKMSDLTPQVSRVTSYFYTLFCKNRYKNSNAKLALDPNYTNQGVMDKVVLPAFFNRKVVICPPLPQEAAQILRNLYMSDLDDPIPEEVKTLLLKQGYLMFPEVLHRVVVLVDCISQSLLGAIHFTIRSNPMHCRVKSLAITPSAQGKKYGSLLLSYAIQTAKENKCSSISLKSSEEAIDFYLKFGFMVNSPTIESFDDWDSLNAEEQQSLIVDHDNELLLEFFEDAVESRLEEMLDGAISS